MKTAAVIRHLPFEGLGSYEGVLEAQGYAIRYLEAGFDDLAALDPLACDVLVVLGGPIGVGQEADYPWLADEIEVVRKRVGVERPTLGVCLGAQIVAHTLGAEVATASTPEIGWAPLELTAAGRESPLRHLEGVPVLHWHGDRFELPVAPNGSRRRRLVQTRRSGFRPMCLRCSFIPKSGGPNSKAG